MLEKDTFLKKIRLKNLFFFLFFFLNFESSLANEIKGNLIKHIDSLNNFSAKFIQSNDSGIEEGVIYIGEKRIKVEYSFPSKVTIILDKRRSMYFNRDLQEVEYFNTKKSEANIFFQILKDNSFLDNAEISNKKKNVFIKKKYAFEDSVYLAELIFEQNPYILRKIKISFNETYYTISFFDHSYNQDFRKNFFSLANPLILN
jgi:Outer membrane lipoprotein-sorting protein